MKTKTLLTSLAVGIIFSGIAIGGPVNYNNSAPSSALFGPETSLDVFASYLKSDQEGVSKSWGGGLGVSHFFTSYLGVAGSASWVEPDNSDVWGNYIADGIIRVPIESLRIAPYALAGLGGIYGDSEFNFVGRVGAGIDFRITESFGVFGDWLYHFPEGNTGIAGENYATTRIGLKIIF
jgi:hypothetical protein